MGGISFIVHVDMFIFVHVDAVLLDLSLLCLEVQPPCPGKRPYWRLYWINEVLIRTPPLAREAFPWDTCLDFLGDVSLRILEDIFTWFCCREFGVGL